MTEAEALVRARSALLSIARALNEVLGQAGGVANGAVMRAAMNEARRTLEATADAGSRARVIASAEAMIDEAIGRQP